MLNNSVQQSKHLKLYAAYSRAPVTTKNLNQESTALKINTALQS
jgi:hypothetical protein